MREVEAVVAQQPRAAAVGVDAREHAVDAAPGRRPARSTCRRGARRTAASGCHSAARATPRPCAPRLRCRASRRPRRRPPAPAARRMRAPDARDRPVACTCAWCRPGSPCPASTSGRSCGAAASPAAGSRRSASCSGVLTIRRPARGDDRDPVDALGRGTCASRARAGSRRCRSRSSTSSPDSHVLDRLHASRPPIVTGVPSTRHWSSSPTTARLRCSPASSCSQRYCAWLVSWYSSTRTWRKRGG